MNNNSNVIGTIQLVIILRLDPSLQEVASDLESLRTGRGHNKRKKRLWDKAKQFLQKFSVTNYINEQVGIIQGY